MLKITIGIDLGGTRIKAVAIDESGNILHQFFQATNDGDDTIWKNAILIALKEIKGKVKCAGSVIGISAPGLPNANNSAIAYMPGRLQGLENFEWTEFLKMKTFVLNDAISAMMGEARFGAAKDRKNVVMITLGTGVGGAILIDGKPYQGSFNKAGHIGHMVIDSEGEQDIIGMPGSLEDAIGNCSIEKRTSGKFKTTHQLLEAFRNGDSFAKEIWLTSVKKLAIGLASITNILSPEMIIIGGGIAEAGNDLFEPLENFMDKYEWRAGGNQTEIVKAQYGDFSGAVGAACFAREQKRK
ncbi:MAG: ROK family protein [Bacteroidota bacterium]|jgi:glucokinase|nr:ROK family protein [Bacteroidota bacterium]MDP3432353.1 ROK family protein [Bacteroidota bacterium]